jgi:hypothetical protein
MLKKKIGEFVSLAYEREMERLVWFAWTKEKKRMTLMMIISGFGKTKELGSKGRGKL